MSYARDITEAIQVVQDYADDLKTDLEESRKLMVKLEAKISDLEDEIFTLEDV